MEEPYILYGVPHSLYTGKTRSYLRKQGLRYVERTPSAPEFREQVMPAIGRAIIPVVVGPGHLILQDTVDILSYFEDRGAPVSARPPGPRQRVLSHVIEFYAVVALTRHAMHYRWSYFEAQETFLRDAFAAGSGGDFEGVMRRMASYLPGLGVTHATIPLIERSYGELLDALEAHFADHPYLFGGQPSIGDYGLLGPLFAHLGRDPVPADIMRRRAPRVARWVERMNAPDADMPEYGERAAAFLPGDEVPHTLEPLLAQAAYELVPELEAKLQALSAYVAEHDPQEGQQVSPRPHQRVIGVVSSTFRGAPCDTGLQPYMLYLWQRITDAYAGLDAAQKASVLEYLQRCGLALLVEANRPIRVERRDHIEVWGRRGG